MEQQESCCGWVKLYHPRGPLVTLPAGRGPVDYKPIFANVSAALDAGFLVNAPGLEQGETRLEITSVVRMTKENRDRSESPMIALYEHGNAFKSLTVYLDTEDDITSFLRASGLRNLQELPLLDGTTAPERGKSKSADGKVITLPKPFGVIVGPNPRYDAGKAARATQADPYTVPKTVFVRWAELAPLADPTKAPPTQQVTDDEVVQTWQAFLKSDPAIPDLNERIRVKMPAMEQGLRARVWAAVKEHAKAAGLRWSDGDRGYVAATPSR